MPEIVFKRGDKLPFIATRSFALGNTGMNLAKGQEILFDGTTADVGGDDLSLPTLRGAIKAGWLVLAQNYDPDDDEAERPKSAGIQVHHPTQGGNPMDMRSRTAGRTAMTTTESDEREVGNIRQHADQAKQANTNYRRGQPVNPQMRGGAENQDGVEVRKLKTPSGERAKQTRTVLTAGSLGQAMKDTEVTISAGQGISEEEYVSRLDPAAASEYLATKAAKRAQYVDEDAPKVVGRVAKSKAPTRTEGFTSPLSVGGGIETGDLSGMDPGKAKKATMTVEGMTFQTTNGPEGGDQAHPRENGRPAQAPVIVRQASADVRRMVAKQLCKDFPDNYDFTAADKKKLARLQADYEDRHDVLKAVFAAEGDAFKMLLIQEFPEAFAS